MRPAIVVELVHHATVSTTVRLSIIETLSIRSPSPPPLAPPAWLTEGL